MKILKLDLLKYGHINNGSLDLSGGEHGLHLIVGPNEAGKSTTRRAVQDMLFGLPAPSKQPFLHINGAPRVGGSLRIADGSVFGFVRSKGKAKSIQTPDGSTYIDPAVLNRHLGRVSRNLFQTMFSIDQDRLIEGGAAIANGNGDVAQSLFIGGSGISSTRRIQKELQDESDRLFLASANAIKPEINSRLKRWKELEQELQATQLAASLWEDVRENLRKVTAEREAIVQREKALTKQQSRLQRLLDVRPDVDALRHSEIDLRELGEPLILRDDFSEERRKIEGDLKIVETRIQTTANTLSQKQVAYEALDADETILSYADEIASLIKKQGAWISAKNDLVERRVEVSEYEQLAARKLAELDPDARLEDVESFRLTVQQQTTLRELIRKHESLITALELNRRTLDRNAESLRVQSAALDQLSVPEAESSLKQTIEDVLSEGPLDEKCVEADRAVREAGSVRDSAIKRIGFDETTWGSFDQTALPDSSAVDDWEQRFRERGQTQEQAVRQVESLQQKLRKTQSQRRSLEQKGRLLTEDDLQAAREHRHQLWKTIRNRWLEEEHNPDRNVRSRDELPFGPDPEVQDLIEQYLQAVTNADQIADQIRQDAERVGQAAAIASEIEELKGELATAEANLSAARTSYQELSAGWRVMCGGMNVDVESPAHLRKWLESFGVAVTADDEFQRLRRQLAILEESQKRCMSRLRTAIGSDAVTDSEVVRVDDLLSIARQQLDREQAAKESQRELKRELERLTEEQVTLKAEAKSLQRELAQWQAEWEASCSPVGLAGETRSAVLDGVLSTTAELFDFLEKADASRHRVAEIEASGEAFQQNVRTLVDALAIHPASDDPIEVAQELDSELSRIQAEFRQRKQLADEIGALQSSLQTYETDATELQQRLALLCGEANSESPGELPELERRSRLAAQLHSRITELRERVVRAAAGQDYEDFLAAALAADVDELPTEIQTLTAQIGELTDKRDELTREAAILSNELKAMDGSDKATHVAEQREALRAELEEHMEDYARARVTQVLLQRGIERYRERNQHPLLDRAGNLFRELTCGSFSGLRIEFDDQDQQELVGIRGKSESQRGHNEQVSISGMSEGTCDQLYLALRIASLEHHFQDHEPLPFIVDDVLVNFDDDRASAALKVFAELSRTTQVIFFTHHQHLVELARTNLPDETLFVHDLSSIYESRSLSP